MASEQTPPLTKKERIAPLKGHIEKTMEANRKLEAEKKRGNTTDERMQEIDRLLERNRGMISIWQRDIEKIEAEP